MRIKQRAQHIGNPVLKILRNCAGRHVAVQVALAAALLQLVSQRIGHRYKGHTATMEGDLAIIEFFNQLCDRLRAAGFVAVDRAKDQ